MVERVVIVGAGRTSDSLVQRLSRMAPVVVLDTAQSALSALTIDRWAGRSDGVSAGRDPAGSGDEGDGTPSPTVLRYPVEKRLADGTSRLVLEDLRGPSSHPVALVAATGEDRKNLEICRLGSALGYQPLVAIAIDPAVAPKYQAFGVRAIVRASLLGDVVERALRYDGLAVASNLGLGRGDIIEIRVLPSSPVVGQPLAELHAEGWRIAAIYRGDSLVIPTGATAIEGDDRVLLVGDPGILPWVAESLRIGVPDFPRRYGPHIVLYLPNGRDRATEGEAEVLTIKTRAERLIRLHPGAEPSSLQLIDGIGDEGEPPATVDAGPPPPAAAKTAGAAPPGQPKWFDDAPLEGSTLAEHAACILRHRPGLVVTTAEAPSLWHRLVGSGGRAQALCNALTVPVLFRRGEPHYDRILLVASGGSWTPRVAETAIDLARELGKPLFVVRVDLPPYLGGPDPSVERMVDEVSRRTRLYGLASQVVRREGNPIIQVLKLAQPSDLLVVGRPRSRRDSFGRPDVALRIVAGAPCSSLVITV